MTNRGIRAAKPARLVVAMVLGVCLTTAFQAATFGAAAAPETRRPAVDSPANQGLLSYVSQTTLVEADGTFEAVFEVLEPDLLPAAAELDVTIYSLLEESAELDSEPVGPLNRLPTQQIVGSRNQSDQIEIAFETRSSASANGSQVLLPDPGVYPIVIDIRDEDTVIESIRTNLIRLPQPVNAEPSPESELLPASLILDARGGELSLEKSNRLLTRAEDTPLTVLVDEATIAALEEGGIAASTFIRKSSEITTVVSPGDATDVSSLAAVEQGDLYQQRMQRLRQRAEQLGLEPDASTTTTISPITETGAQALRSFGFTTALNIGTPASDAPNYGTIETSSGGIGLLSRQLQPQTNPGAGAIWADRLLAPVVIEQSADPVPKLLLVDGGAPEDFEADELTILLEGNGSLFRLTTTNELLSATGPIAPAANPAIDLANESQLIRDVTTGIESFETSYVDGDTSPTNYEDALVRTIGEAPSSEAREQQLQELSEEIRNDVQSIRLPRGQAVTVAAQSVPVPLTIENSSSGSRKFLLRSESDKVQIAQHEEVIVVPPGSSSIDLDVEVRSLGVSPVQISLFTPDGKNRLASTRFEVRSTAIPGLGLLLCAAGAVLLAFWWYVHERRRRNRKKERAATGDPANPFDEARPNPASRQSKRASATNTKAAESQTNDEVASGNLT